MKKFNAVIIGFGKGGKTLAGKLAGTGKTVAVVERSSQMYGGTCINVGCIPSKSLVHSADHMKLHPEDAFESKAAQYAEAVAEKRRLTAMLRKKNYDKLAQLPNVTIYDGTASFLSPTQVKVTADGEEIELEADQIFINTGSTSVLPEIEGMGQSSRVYTSATLMDLDRLPRRLVIVGGGYIGLEFASMYTNFGSQVTILQHGGTFLPREDDDISGEIKKSLEQRGVSVLLNAGIQKISEKEDCAEIIFQQNGEEKTMEADAILLATGRHPNTEDLNPAAAGISLTERGAVVTDEALRTTAPNIWAMGDVVGGLQFTYVSLDDSRIVWSQLNGGEYTTKKRANIPYSVFIDPSFSRVGLNEKEALKAGYRIKTAKLPAAAIPKAQVLKHPTGMLKAIIDMDTNQILGAMLFCEESYEMINIVKLAMDLHAEYTVLRDQIFTHPTMSEALNDLFSAVN